MKSKTLFFLIASSAVLFLYLNSPKIILEKKFKENMSSLISEEQKCQTMVDRRNSSAALNQAVEACISNIDKLSYFLQIHFFFDTRSNRWSVYSASGLSDQNHLFDLVRNDMMSCIDVSLKKILVTNNVDHTQFKNRYTENYKLRWIKLFKDDIKKEARSFCRIISMPDSSSQHYHFEDKAFQIRDNPHNPHLSYKKDKTYKQFAHCEKYLSTVSPLIEKLDIITNGNNQPQCLWKKTTDLSSSYKNCVCKIYLSKWKKKYEMQKRKPKQAVTFVIDDGKTSIEYRTESQPKLLPVNKSLFFLRLINNSGIDYFQVDADFLR